jgi:hypothetical protein
MAKHLLSKILTNLNVFNDHVLLLGQQSQRKHDQNTLEQVGDVF